MQATLLQNMIDIVFKGNLLYLSPILFILAAVFSADKLIELISNAIAPKSGRRSSQ